MRWRTVFAVVILAVSPVGLSSQARNGDTVVRRDANAPAGSKNNPAHVSSGMMMGNVVRQVFPHYPPTHCGSHPGSGVSVMHVVINPGGKVNRLEWLSGRRDYRKPVMHAVRHWRYKPYLLNGKAVWVETTVTLEVNVGCIP